MRWVWAAAGLVSVALGLVGAVLPLMPTVPFMLLAAFCFARSSERLHHWLITHPRFGSAIVDWQERRAISRRAKQMATLSMAAGIAISWALSVPAAILATQVAVLVCVAAFLWSRPEA
ncbi:YbaN family protein [Halodurantibacterium flavum]|uniref:YbaN family protein n=1 Tax=Halodurantibacterium flavum TaxID=1382802 RepID=A0ABW4S890_9RHOB